LDSFRLVHSQRFPGRSIYEREDLVVGIFIRISFMPLDLHYAAIEPVHPFEEFSIEFVISER